MHWVLPLSVATSFSLGQTFENTHCRKDLKTHSGETSNKCNQCDYDFDPGGCCRYRLPPHFPRPIFDSLSLDGSTLTLSDRLVGGHDLEALPYSSARAPLSSCPPEQFKNKCVGWKAGWEQSKGLPCRPSHCLPPGLSSTYMYRVV